LIYLENQFLAQQMHAVGPMLTRAPRDVMNSQPRTLQRVVVSIISTICAMALSGTASAQLFGPIDNGSGPPSSPEGGLILNNVFSDLSLDFGTDVAATATLQNLGVNLGVQQGYEFTISLVTNPGQVVTAQRFEPPSLAFTTADATVIFATTEVFSAADVQGTSGLASAWSYGSDRILVPLNVDAPLGPAPGAQSPSGTVTLLQDLLAPTPPPPPPGGATIPANTAYDLFEFGGGSALFSWDSDVFAGGGTMVLPAAGPAVGQGLLPGIPVSIAELLPGVSGPLDPTNVAVRYDLCWGPAGALVDPRANGCVDPGNPNLLRTGQVVAGVVPEPGMAGLLGLGVVGLVLATRGRRRAG
jgi:hypothetical protein